MYLLSIQVGMRLVVNYGMQIPFNANEYYLKYLPPMVSGRSEDWSEEEKKELLETVNVRMRIVCECRIILQMISGVCFHFIFLVVQVKKYG